MQLKITRSQRESGILSKTAVFIIDARVHLTHQEQQCVQRDKLGGLVIYDSAAKNRMMERSDNARATPGRPIDYQGEVGSMLGSAASSMASGVFSATKSLAFAALASMKLSITINSLVQGQHVECKSLDELLGAEEAIMTACQNLKSYIDTASTFDGREILFSFDTGAAEVIATSATPAPMLVSDPISPSAPVYDAPAEPEPELSVHPLAAAYVETEDTASSYEDAQPPQNANELITQKNVLIGIGVLMAAFLLYSNIGTKKAEAGSLTGTEPSSQVAPVIRAYDGIKIDSSNTTPSDYHPEVDNVPPGYKGPVFFNGQQMLIPYQSPDGSYIAPCKAFHQSTVLRPDIVFGCDG